jgi:myo-inositol-1(or 4)-monophosphatase
LSEAADALAIARSVASEAAALVRGAGGNIGQVRSKSNPRDLVTEWDTRLEEQIRGRLAVLTPAIPVLGEEAGASGGAGADRWLVDPIDGTVNFAHGLPFFSICLALERAGSCVAGVVQVPALGWEFHAHRGGGAFLGAERLQVSRVAQLEDAMLATGFPYDRATSPHNNFAEWEHFQRRAGACRRFGAASIDLAFVARGWFDGYWESRLHPWDLAAGCLLVEEAGGQVTAIDGGPFHSDRGNAVASNGVIHRQILAELAAVASR